MLKEEAHHNDGGHQPGVDRVVQRTVEGDARARPPTTWPAWVRSRCRSSRSTLNFHYSVSLDLFGGETSTNVANYYTAGAQGPLARGPAQGRSQARQRRDHGGRPADRRSQWRAEHRADRGSWRWSALNTDLRREYISDCQGGVKRWNRILEEGGVSQAAAGCRTSPSNRQGGAAFAGIEATPGRREDPGWRKWQRRQGQWLPTDVGQGRYVRSLMQPVHQRGKDWPHGSHRRGKRHQTAQPFDYDYVHLA